MFYMHIISWPFWTFEIEMEKHGKISDARWGQQAPSKTRSPDGPRGLSLISVAMGLHIRLESCVKMMHHGENLVYNQMNSSSNNNNIPPHIRTNIGRVCARTSNFARVCCSTYLLASCIGSNEHSHFIFFSKMLLATIDTKAYTVNTLRVRIRPPAFPPFLSLLSSHSYVLALSVSVSDLTVPTCWCEAEREKSE